MDIEHHNSFIVYTDGSCDNNITRQGGWSYIFLNDDDISEIIDELILHEEVGFDSNTTNNRMELKAILKALEYIKNQDKFEIRRVEFRSDSMYAINAITLWRYNWEKNNFIKNGFPISNSDILKMIYIIIDSLQKDNFIKIRFKHVKGHGSNVYNNYCDKKCSYKNAKN